MSRKPIHEAPARDEAPTTRLKRISDIDEIDAIDRLEDSSDEDSCAPVEPSRVIGLDADSSFCVGFSDVH